MPLRMLVCYVRDLREGFWPYVDEVAKIMVPLLAFYFNDQVGATFVQGRFSDTVNVGARSSVRGMSVPARCYRNAHQEQRLSRVSVR